MFFSSESRSVPATDAEDTITPRKIHDLQHEAVSSDSGPPVDETQASQTFCVYCRNAPCILAKENLPAWLRAHAQPRRTNRTKRKGDYKKYYTVLKSTGRWNDPVYLSRKEALSCYIFNSKHNICFLGLFFTDFSWYRSEQLVLQIGRCSSHWSPFWFSSKFEIRGRSQCPYTANLRV